jgi:RimJ/RimL family protein N-acetyltransferase
VKENFSFGTPSLQISKELRLEFINEKHIPDILNLIECNLNQLKGSYFSKERIWDKGEYRQEILDSINSTNKEKDICFCIFWNDKIIGEFTLHSFLKNFNGYQTSLWIRAELQNRGIGSAVGSFVTKWAFNNLEWLDSILYMCYDNNEASKKSIKKQGYKFLKDWAAEDDILTYMITKEEWKKKENILNESSNGIRAL